MTSPLLMLAPEPPVPARSGLPLRILHLARELARDHDVEVAAISGSPVPDHGEPFAVTHVPGDWDTIGAVFRSAWQPWSVAQIRSEALAHHVGGRRWSALSAHSLPMLRYLRPGTPSVFDAPDVLSGVARTLAITDSRRARRPAWRFEQAKAMGCERLVVRRAIAVTACTDADAAYYERLGARRLTIVPNGVDTDAISPGLPSAGAEIVYVGYFAWRPNVEAALELIHQIMPRIRAREPSARLSLVGPAAPRELTRTEPAGTTLAGAVDDVRPHLRRARLTVIPLRAGSGSRLKVLEALAAGVPVVATPFAVTGLGLRHREQALIGRTPGELAELAARVIADDELARSLSAAGRRHVEQHFAWNVVARPLRQLHAELRDRTHR